MSFKKSRHHDQDPFPSLRGSTFSPAHCFASHEGGKCGCRLLDHPFWKRSCDPFIPQCRCDVLRILWWLPGPILATALLAFAAASGFRVVVFMAYFAGAMLLMFAVPAIQWSLLATDRFRGRHAASCGVALLAVALLISVPFLVRAFEQL